MAANLRRAREEAGWSQDKAGAELKKHLGERWHRATWSMVEQGNRTVTPDELVALSLMFDKPLAYWFTPPAGEPAELGGATVDGELMRLLMEVPDELAERFTAEAIQSVTARAIGLEGAMTVGEFRRLLMVLHDVAADVADVLAVTRGWRTARREELRSRRIIEHIEHDEDEEG